MSNHHFKDAEISMLIDFVPLCTLFLRTANTCHDTSIYHHSYFPCMSVFYLMVDYCSITGKHSKKEKLRNYKKLRMYKFQTLLSLAKYLIQKIKENKRE